MDPSDLLDGEEVFLRADGKGFQAEEIGRLFSPLGFFTAKLDGELVKNKEDMMAATAMTLKFPSYFGRNWDALLDCLRSLPEFLPSAGYILVIERSGSFLKDNPEDMETFRDILSTAAEFLFEKYKIKFRVVML